MDLKLATKVSQFIVKKSSISEKERGWARQEFCTFSFRTEGRGGMIFCHLIIIMAILHFENGVNSLWN